MLPRWTKPQKTFSDQRRSGHAAQHLAFAISLDVSGQFSQGRSKLLQASFVAFIGYAFRSARAAEARGRARGTGLIRQARNADSPLRAWSMVNAPTATISATSSRCCL